MFKFNLLWEITAGDEPLPYKCRIIFFVFYTAELKFISVKKKFDGWKKFKIIFVSAFSQGIFKSCRNFSATFDNRVTG